MAKGNNIRASDVAEGKGNSWQCEYSKDGKENFEYNINCNDYNGNDDAAIAANREVGKSYTTKQWENQQSDWKGSQILSSTYSTGVVILQQFYALVIAHKTSWHVGEVSLYEMF